MHHLRTRNPGRPEKGKGGPKAALAGRERPRYRTIAIHGSPRTRKATMKMTPNTAPRTQ